MSIFIRWLGRFMEDGHTGYPSVQYFGFALCVSVLSIIMGIFGGVIAAVVWMQRGSAQAVELMQIISSSLEVISGLVMASVTTGYVASKAVERQRKGKLPSREEAAKT